MPKCPKNWCRFGLIEACPYGSECEYVHLMDWLVGGFAMQSILQRDKNTLQGNFKKAVAAAKENGRTDIMKTILTAMSNNGMFYDCNDDGWVVVTDIVELVCGTLHYDLGGMHDSFKPVIFALADNLSEYVPKGALKKSPSTSSRVSGDYSDCALSSAGSDSVTVSDLAFYDEHVGAELAEFISMYYV
eukprot:TRINITY_DN650_c9_g1_i1.p1 TRINITY_DN650_c9_g1~~TRINITY_DN650_c9_g1_i1.p1  ORF type:complete len:188 (+),score=35.43 TRINITY_DN650_c9_g1_i1:92-655(+)